MHLTGFVFWSCEIMAGWLGSKNREKGWSVVSSSRQQVQRNVFIERENERIYVFGWNIHAFRMNVCRCIKIKGKVVTHITTTQQPVWQKKVINSGEPIQHVCSEKIQGWMNEE